MYKYVKFFKDISLADVSQVGGKNASLGEMYRYLAPKGINLPNGFATTSQSYFYFLEQTGLKQAITDNLTDLDIHDVRDWRKEGLASGR